MKLTLGICFLLVLLGCKKDPESVYPIVYTLDHIEQSDEGLYLVEGADQVAALPTDIGFYGVYKEQVKVDVLEALRLAFDLKKIELLDEDSLQMKGFIENEAFDITLGYERVDGAIVIDSIEGTVLTYEKDDDQFIICGVTKLPIAGPNAINPGPPAYLIVTSECLTGFTIEDYAHAMLEEYAYPSLDTLGVFLTRLVFK